MKLSIQGKRKQRNRRMDSGLFALAVLFLIFVFIGTLYLILTEPKRKLREGEKRY